MFFGILVPVIGGRAAFGPTSFLSLPAFHAPAPVEYLLYAGLGILAAAVGVGFTKALYGTEDLLDRLWRGPEWLRPTAGGVLLGLLLLGLPQMYGVGYPVLEAGVRGQYMLWFLLVGKIVAVSLTIGIGGSGGVFAPSLFIGAMLGTAYGLAPQHLFGGVASPAGAYGLAGMGAVFAGAARALITAVLIIFELTGDYTIILPLMTAIALATGVSNLLSAETIYTLKLRRRGIDLLRGKAANLMELLTVADAMAPRAGTRCPSSTTMGSTGAPSPPATLRTAHGRTRWTPTPPPWLARCPPCTPTRAWNRLSASSWTRIAPGCPSPPPTAVARSSAG